MAPVISSMEVAFVLGHTLCLILKNWKCNFFSPFNFEVRPYVLIMIFTICDQRRRKGGNIENIIFGNTDLKVWVHRARLTNVEYPFFDIILLLRSVTNLQAWYLVVRVLYIVKGVGVKEE